MQKIISWIVLAALVVLVPLGSWIYLKKGLDWRKGVLHELVVKSVIDKSLDTSNVFLSKTSLLVFEESEEIKNALQPIYDQFKDAYTFQVVSQYDYEYNVRVTDGYLDRLIQQDGSTFAIVDTGLQVRNYYTLNNSDLKSMVEHLAVVIPLPKEKDIKLK